MTKSLLEWLRIWERSPSAVAPHCKAAADEIELLRLERDTWKAAYEGSREASPR